MTEPDLRCYRIFGTTLETDFDFDTPLLPSDDPPELHFRLLARGTAPPSRPGPGAKVFESPVRIDGGLPLFTVHRSRDGDLLRFTEVADFLLSEGSIQARLLDPEYRHMIEVHLLGLVLSFWLERRGVPVLHAAAVSVSESAVGFIGTNRGGKSSLAVSLMRRGHPLLSDDLLGLQLSETGVEVRPGFPSMRMWPDLAREVVEGAWEDMPLAHPWYDKRRVKVGPGGFGRFLDCVRPLGRLYLPTRRDPGEHGLEVQIESVPPREAVFELLRGSFLPRLTQAAGLASDRMELFGALTQHVPVRRLLYPSGFEHLDRVSERILEDSQEEPQPGRTPGP